MIISLSEQEKKLVKSLQNRYTSLAKKQAEIYTYSLHKNGAQIGGRAFTSRRKPSLMFAEGLLLKLYGSNIQSLKEVKNHLSITLSPHGDICREKDFISIVNRFYRRESEAPFPAHEYQFIKGDALIETGTIQANFDKKVLERIREYLEKYKDSVLYYLINQSACGGTLLRIILKD